MSIVYNTKPAVSVREFIPRIQAALSGIDVEMAAQYVVDAAITFARDSQVLREIICVELIPCQDSYRLETPYRIAEVVSVREYRDPDCGFFGGFSPNTSAYVVDSVLYVSPVPSDQQSGVIMEVEVSMIPSRSSSELPEALFEDWVEAVTHMALSKLYLLSDSPWYSLGASRENMSWYKQLLMTAKMHNFTKHKPLNIRLAPRHLRGRR